MMALVTRSTPNAKIFFFLMSTSFLSGTWVKADSFLGHKGGFGRLSGYIPSRFLNTFNVEQELESALREALGLGHGLTEEAAETKTGQVNTMFQTMPKNMYGRVGRDAMQYMVSRYFGEHYGWSIKGFDPASKGGNASQEAAPVTILQEKLPQYVETVVEERLERHGFALNDVVTMVVVLERMIFDEGLGMLEDAYYLQEKETVVPMNHSELVDVVLTYMMIYGFQAERRNRTDFPYTVGKIVRDYPKGWPSALYGLSEMETELAKVRSENPFVDRRSSSGEGYSFDVTARITRRASENYGKWTTGEQCADLKANLVKHDREGNGRVRLVDFYKMGNVSNNWFMEESSDYLRHVGALDESSGVRGPQVIIANYVQQPSNCLEVSSFYSICCLKECESLLGRIEREIRAPFASPARLIEVVQGMLNAKLEEPLNLTTQMLSQLDLVAKEHGGQVPLHGRLFSQWLHYAFPYECPYPQLTYEAENFLPTSEYAKRHQDPMLSWEQVESYIAEHGGNQDGPASAPKSPGEEDDLEELMSQWTMEEELYVGYHHQGPRLGVRGSGTWSMLGLLAKVGIVLGGFFQLRPLLSGAFRLIGGGDASDMKPKGGTWNAHQHVLV